METKEEAYEPYDARSVRQNDIDCSINCLFQSFLTWHRLQYYGVVRLRLWNKIRSLHDSTSWKDQYPSRFTMLHAGGRDPDAILLGRGKYAKVYSKDSMHAVKIVKFSATQDPDYWAHLRCNMRELAYFHSLHHPNLTRGLASQMVMAHGRFHCLIHEMSRARYTLMDMIYQHQITCFMDLTHLFRGVARALQYMHRAHIAHGDVKPANVLITNEFEAHLTDFTLTTFTDKGPDSSLGTLCWRPPECLRNTKGGTPADVWGFGTMLLDALYGCCYFGDILNISSDVDMLQKLPLLIGQPDSDWAAAHLPPSLSMYTYDPLLARRIQETPVSLTISAAQIKTTRDLIEKCLHWNPDSRATMNEVLNHPFFHTAAVPSVNPDPWREKPTAQAIKVCIRWRDTAEKDHLAKLAQSAYQRLLETKDSAPAWFVQDVVVLSKRVLNVMQEFAATCHIGDVTYYCASVWAFLWCHYTPSLETPMFESIMFHVFYLLQYHVFALDLKEEVDSKKPLPSAQTEKTSTPPFEARTNHKPTHDILGKSQRSDVWYD